MPRLQTRLCVLAVLTIVVACEAPSSRAASTDSGVAAGAMSMPATSAGQADSSIEATVTAVTNDVIALKKATPAVAVGKLPAHEQLVNGMLTNFETRIRAMHVQTDPAWTSVIDSVRTDLARLPAMKPESLPGFLPQHLNRVMRIVACIQMVKS